jgi:choline dehydrogenase-like flavoprotein
VRAVIIGSGPSGTAAATALVDNGWVVDMVDAGRPRPKICAELSDTLLEELRDRNRATLRTLTKLRFGDDLSAQSEQQRMQRQIRRQLNPTRNRKRVLGSKFAFDSVDRLFPVDGGDPARALAAGGLSNVWGSACYGLAETPKFWPPDSAPESKHYQRAFELLGVDQEEDGLAGAYPLYGHQATSGQRNTGSVIEVLLERWRTHSADLKESGISAGRSRLAVAFSGQNACVNCGLCYAGCPTDAIFHSDQRLSRLAATGRFRLLPSTFVIGFQDGGDGTLSLETTEMDGNPKPPMTGYGRVVLAAGALSSFRIAAQSLGRPNAEVGLLDNDMIFVPFLAKTWGQRLSGRHRFALSEAALSVSLGPKSEDHLHAQFYALHPLFFGTAGDVLDSLPNWLGALPRAALSPFLIGLLYLPSHFSRQARLTANPGSSQSPWRLALTSEENPLASAKFSEAMVQMRRSSALALSPIPALMRTTPLGFSGHFGGTLPMRKNPEALETDTNGRLGADRRVAVADASAFPTMPAQNPTLTVVANAIRVASLLQRE